MLTHDLTTGSAPRRGSRTPGTTSSSTGTNRAAPGRHRVVFVDGDYSADKSKSKVTIPAGFNFAPNTPRTTSFGGLDGDVIVGNSTIPSSSHDPDMNPDLGPRHRQRVLPSQDAGRGAVRRPPSRYHDISVRSGPRNYTSLTGRSDTTGNHGILPLAPGGGPRPGRRPGPATLLTIACIALPRAARAQHGSHDGIGLDPGSTTDGTALGSRVDRDRARQPAVQLPVTTTAPARRPSTRDGDVDHHRPTQDLRLVVKMETSETSDAATQASARSSTT